MRKAVSVMGNLRTNQFGCAGRSCPLPEYPRPQLKREQWKNLNGVYSYGVTVASHEKPHRMFGKILVPYCIESELSGVGRALMPDENLWYERSFTVPEEWNGKQIMLNFGAVDWESTVWINEKRVGSHVGGYCPFSFDITDYLTESGGENTLTVRVYDPTDSSANQRGKQTLKPGGIFYTATSGIWQTVWLEPVEKEHIEHIWFVPDIDAGGAYFNARVSGEADKFHLLIEADGAKVFDGEAKIGDFIKIPNPVLWSPENPFLYTVKVTLLSEKSQDCAETYFGMRKFSTGRDEKGQMRLFLNNKPYFQTGLLDQGYWPESLLTPPTDESMIFDIAEMKKLGFNMLRKHIKVEPARWYYHCDRLGMIVWQDMVSGGARTPFAFYAAMAQLKINPGDKCYKLYGRESERSRGNYEKELSDMILNLRCFTSIYCWVTFNEAWGQFDSLRISQNVKKTDPSRIVDHASGWFDQGGGDVRSIHCYIRSLPKVRDKRGRAYALTEYGGYSMVSKGHSFDEKKSFGYKMYKNKAALTEAYEKLVKNQVLPLIPQGLSATVYTQLSDVELEVNGIMSYDRSELKIDEGTLKILNQRMKSALD